MTKTIAPDLLILLFFPNNFCERTITSNRMPEVKIKTDRWGLTGKKIILLIPQFSSPSLALLYQSQIPLKPQIGDAL